MSDFSDVAVIVMAWRRPYYLAETLASWAAADGIREIRSFVIGLGEHERKGENLQVIAEAEQVMGRPIWILPDSPRAQASPAMHRPMAEACNAVWADKVPGVPDAGWVILSEEDNTVSDDVLHYMRWARDTFEDRNDVLLVCAHNLPWVEDWFGPAPAERDTIRESDQDPAMVRLKQGFDSHAWGTWRNRWERILEPTWDYECNSGGPSSSGCDWNIATRVMPHGGYVAVAPDASRSANIGKDEGVYMNPADWRPESAFKPVYGKVNYRLIESTPPDA
jgi:hypothetical protein